LKRISQAKIKNKKVYRFKTKAGEKKLNQAIVEGKTRKQSKKEK